MYKQKDYDFAFADFKKNNEIEAAKYQSEHSDTIVLAYLMQTQRLPTQTTVQIAIQELVRKGLLFAPKENLRTVRALAQKGLDEASANAEREPLTKAEMDEFAGLSFADLQKRYWGDDLKATDYFSVRYRMAARQHGFRIPARPAVQEEGEVTSLTAEEYRRIPAATVVARYRRGGSFKIAFDRLVAAGQI
jgi:predicted transcriptional regulator